MTQLREFITPVQRGKMPSFVRTDYPAFAKYIVDYFTFLEENGNALQVLEEWRRNADIHSADEAYADAILRDLGWNWTGELHVTRAVLLANLRDFYLSRGTLRSFKFLFRTLFNEDVQVRYPREEMLYLDQADYASEIKMYAAATEKDTPIFLSILDDLRAGDHVEIVGQISGAVATVEDIRILLSGDEAYLEISILQPLKSFVPREALMITGEGGFIIEQGLPIAKLTVTYPGYGFSVGQDIPVAGAGLTGLIRVASLKAGNISSLAIASAGQDYEVGDKLTAAAADGDYGFGFFGRVSSVGVTGNITGVQITSPGKEYKTIPTIRIASATGSGGNITAGSGTIGAINQFKVYQPYVDFDPGDASATASPATFAVSETATFSSKAYRDRRGVLGENSILIDSGRYQQFSYDLLTPVQTTRHRSVVDEFLHPAGYVRTDVLRFEESVDDNVTGETEAVVTVGVQDTLLEAIDGDAIVTVSGNYIKVRK